MDYYADKPQPWGELYDDLRRDAIHSMEQVFQRASTLRRAARNEIHRSAPDEDEDAEHARRELLFS